MIIAACWLVFGLIAVGALLLAFVAIGDCMSNGDRQIEEAVRQREAARDVTGRVSR